MYSTIKVRNGIQATPQGRNNTGPMCSAPPPAGSELDAAAVTVWHLKSGAWQSVAGPIRIRRPMRDSVWQALGPDQQASAWHETSLPTWPGSSCRPDQCEPDEVMCSAVQGLPARPNSWQAISRASNANVELPIDVSLHGGTAPAGHPSDSSVDGRHHHRCGGAARGR
jgi:hypothetical protein